MRAMLTIYRRHGTTRSRDLGGDVKECPHIDKGRAWRRCQCPIWLDGYVDGSRIHLSLKTRDWQKATEKMRAMEIGEIPEAEATISIGFAVRSYLADATARGIKDESMDRPKRVLASMEAFYTSKGMLAIKQCDIATIRQFRASWVAAPITASKRLEALRAFFRFCVENGWITESPAAKIKLPKITTPPTMPFDREEMVRILAACNDYPDGYGRTGQLNAMRLRAFVLVLRYSGLRIRDVVTLSVERIKDGKLFLRTAKTSTHVWCPLPPPVLNALAVIAPAPGHHFYFWTGTSKPKSAVSDWQRALARLFELAKDDKGKGIVNGHAHRFRDTFAVEMLLAGTPLERVAMLLGHSSVRVTERHYAPWVQARQVQLEADVRIAWAADPIVLAEPAPAKTYATKRLQ